MNMRAEIKDEAAQARQFLMTRESLQLASVSPAGVPHASYCPFGCTDNGFVVMVSDLAEHGTNLKGQGTVSALFIEDEGECKSIFARIRVSFDCNVRSLDKQSPEGKAAIDSMIEKLGMLAGNLAQLDDFTLYQLTPQSGRYIRGFGQAYELEGDGLSNFGSKHMTDNGHQGSIGHGRRSK